MDLGKYGHLTYSTLVHPGDTWPEMWNSLKTYVPQVKKRICPDKPFGVSLRLSNASANVLVNSAAERAQLKSFLADNDLYLYTVNAFPFGPFKNQIVKEQVYEPDWRAEERTLYTMNVADILADVGAPFVNPSIQSPPLGFKPRVTGPEVVEAYAANIRRLAVHLHKLRERTGRTVTLAVEPEPYCFLETTDETVDFFTRVLRSEKSLTALGHDLGTNAEQARTILRRHVGTVYDICHQAVEFENISVSLQKPGRQRRARLQASGSGCGAGPQRQPRCRRRTAQVGGQRVSDADHRNEGRQDDPLPEPRGCDRFV